MFTRLTQAIVAAATVALLAVGSMATPASAANIVVRAGKAVPQAFSFIPLDVGIQEGIFAKHGVDVRYTSFHGDAKMQQAAAAGSIDILVGSGPAMAFIVKGSPIKAVAAMAGPPLLLVVIVRPDGPKTVAELKGKKVSCSTVGSLTYWLLSQTSERQGWGPHGIDILPMGAMSAQIAALKRHQVDGVITDVSTAYSLEEKGEARILVRFNDIKNFHIHVIFATNTFLHSHPEAVRKFLAGWFETIHWMRKHKAETVKIAMKVLKRDKMVMDRTYDEIMPMFSDDGRFNPKALKTLAKSYVQLKILPKEPDMSKLYTEAYLPK